MALNLSFMKVKKALILLFVFDFFSLIACQCAFFVFDGNWMDLNHMKNTGSLLTIVTVSIIVDCFVLYGYNRGQNKYIQAWLIMRGILIVFTGIFITNFIWALASHTYYMRSGEIVFLCFSVPITALDGIIWLVVERKINSERKEAENQRETKLIGESA